jgi:hypothetical protein
MITLTKPFGISVSEHRIHHNDSFLLVVIIRLAYEFFVVKALSLLLIQ